MSEPIAGPLVKHGQRFDNLDNLSDNLRGEWQWQAGNSWNGTLGVGQRRYLSGFTDVQQNIRKYAQ